jgi:glycosyltransferase involved in cell wall biosynthesis
MIIDPHDDLGTAKKPVTVTVLMNSYKEKKELFERAIRSCIDAKADQIILSTVKGDPCVEWAWQFRHVNSSKLIIIENDKPGIFEQINAMLPYITGDYVCYASSNDYMLPEKLVTEVNRLQATAKKVCYSAFHVKSEVSGRQYVAKFPEYSYRENIQNSIVSDCAMVETELFLKYTPFRVEYKNNAYRDLWLRIYEGEGNVFTYNPHPTWVYHVTADSQHIRRKQIPKLQKENLRQRALMLRDHIPAMKDLLGNDPVIEKVTKT